MPSLKKKTLSLYLRSGCERQLALNLYNDNDRAARGMPPRQKSRAGLGRVGRAGHEYQNEKVAQLRGIFGDERVVSLPQLDADAVWGLAPDTWLDDVKYQADTETFKAAVGLDDIRDAEGEALVIGTARPDLIQVMRPMVARLDWEEQIHGLDHELLPTGETRPIADDDTRLRLRIVDIKQSADPGAHYFAEVVYYSMTLAAWVSQHSLQDAAVVVAAPAVMPGSYDTPHIMQVGEACRREGREPTLEELLRAHENDLELAPVAAFSARLQRFLREELAHALQVPWDELPWHVSFKCGGCEFLGYPWLNADGTPRNHHRHCWPTAESVDHVSRITGLTKAGALLIRDDAGTTGDVAELDAANRAFDRSPTLRSKRTVLPSRARSLGSNRAEIVSESGGDALMPKWPDLHVYLFLEYDLASALTGAIAMRGFWIEPLDYRSDLTRERLTWNWRTADFQEVFSVSQRDIDHERRELLKFLRQLRGVIDAIRDRDTADIERGRRTQASTYQIYLWDEAQRRHLIRIIGRHLPAILADPQLRHLAWLFPPPELLAHPEDASFKSPVTLVSSVVRRTVATPVPHHYTLIDVARTYRPDDVAEVSVHPLFRDPLSDLVPGERLYEAWEQIGDWLETANIVRETVSKKLTAMSYVVRRLERDLGDHLVRAAAPPITPRQRALAGVPLDSLVWHEYARLNVALDHLDAHMVRAMPVHEREARFRSARLARRLDGAAKTDAYATLARSAPNELPPEHELDVYELRATSREFNARPPALGYSLAPEADPSFLNRASYPLARGVPGISAPFQGRSVGESGLTGATVIAIDRQADLIALQPGPFNFIHLLEDAERLDLSHNVVLDPTPHDFLTTKLAKTLQGIGRPQSAQDRGIVAYALGTPPVRNAATDESPASEFLWNADVLAGQTLDRPVDAALQQLTEAAIPLNPSQMDAVRASLTRRLAVVWGPPGTGKSHTLRATIAGALLLAREEGRPLRVLVAAGTYNAVDNVLIGLTDHLQHFFADAVPPIYRLRSAYKEPPAEVQASPLITDQPVRASLAEAAVMELQGLLTDGERTIVVGATAHQLHNLSIATAARSKNETSPRTQREWFDLVVVDEASQLDVALATLVVSKAAAGACYTLAGDDRQLPPIQKATPPDQLEDLVGSTYSFVVSRHGVEPVALQVNYRASETLVAFTRSAGYHAGLRAHSPELALHCLEGTFPRERPADWPDQIYWTAAWAQMLDPASPAVCFMYDDDVSGQANDFEANAIVALTRLLFGRVDRHLENERRADRDLPLTGVAFDAEGFWKQGVGIVTPHRAQMGKVVALLQSVFPDHSPGLIWDAVDTVERFQGQQRDLVMASFGMGDADLISAEDEFLYSLNRFNVLTSRARAKLIVMVSRNVVEHLSNNVDVLHDSTLLKNFAGIFCRDRVPLELGFFDADGAIQLRRGTLAARRAP